MVEIAPVNAAGAGQAGTTQTTGQGLGALDSQAFLQLMVAQLRFQNPLQPSDPSAMMQQTATFSQVETMQELAKVQRQLLGLQQVSLATQLVGTEVEAGDAGGETVQGVVRGVRFTAQGPALQVGDEEVALNAVRGLTAHADHAAGTGDAA